MIQMQAKMDELQGKLKAADAVNEKKKTVPFIANLNEDPMLSNVVVYFIEKRLLNEVACNDFANTRSLPNFIMRSQC